MITQLSISANINCTERIIGVAKTDNDYIESIGVGGGYFFIL